MTKTLADMTPEQRTECIGMWCDVVTERYAAVLVRTYMADDVRYAQMLSPEINDYYTAPLDSVTPRFDLPRAWNPDGTPIQAARETITGFAGMNLEDSNWEPFPSVPGTLYERWTTGWQVIE